MPRNPKIEFNEEKMYMGDPYVIDLEDTMGSITVYSPKMGDIIEIGSDKFYQMLNVFICNTTSYRLQLWEMGFDWNTTSDFELFMMLYRSIDNTISRLLFGDLDFSKFKPMPKIANEDIDKPPEERNAKIVLYNAEDEIEINEDVYNHFSQYLQNVFGIFPEEKITKSETLKQWYISKDKRELSEKQQSNKKEEKGFSLKTVISACVNHPGFKYRLSEVKDIGVAEFYDSVRQLQVYEQSTALLKGIYSGFVDGSKIPPENYSFMRKQ